MTEQATFAAGCFWGVEAAFRKIPGVQNATAGYTGGEFENPSYEDVIYKRTGHAEAVQVEFDPKTVSYEQLLKVFWFIHDPTQLNRQGNDVGEQYRSAIFYHSDSQKIAAETLKAEEQKYHDRELATVIEPASTFYSAEDYHQRYLEKNPGGYCHVNLARVAEFVAQWEK
ncbi:peptide-methionine (S)-S-oxide reductase MsrA [Candidatus Berkelbacteria bacterium]|nr:peptide-methionine (S)-S-oxide reductase MsrA [Candidatus Berkelbacteria bacterium]